MLGVGCSGAGTPVEPVSTARCETVEFPELQAGLHLVGDRPPPVPYSSLPPTSGWHTRTAAGPGVAKKPLSEPVQVGLLESGLVMLTHGPGLASTERAQLQELVTEFPETLAVSEYDVLGDGEVALASWGALQRCTELDADAVRRFVAFYATPGSPEHSSTD